LCDLLGQIAAEQPSGDTIVFLGDYIDRGPASRQCIDAILAFRDRVAAEVVCLRGNHEDWLLRTMRDHSRHSWLTGMEGFDTIRSYSPAAEQAIRDAMSAAGLEFFLRRIPLPYDGFFDAMPEAHRRFLETLSVMLENEDGVFVHGGVDCRAPLDQQPIETLIWGGDGFPEGYHGPKVVVYGHWNDAVVDGAGWPHPNVADHTIGIDTISHGVLTAVRMPDRRVFQSARFDVAGRSGK
jgi:serine/threonine protein phosphatase 1